MLSISKYGVIELTRGDTARLSVSITNDVTGEDYTPRTGDVLTLTIRKNVEDAEVKLQKTIAPDAPFHILPDDTSDWAFGKYLYDVQLTTVDGDVYTVIEPNTINKASNLIMGTAQIGRGEHACNFYGWRVSGTRHNTFQYRTNAAHPTTWHISY